MLLVYHLSDSDEGAEMYVFRSSSFSSFCPSSLRVSLRRSYSAFFSLFLFSRFSRTSRISSIVFSRDSVPLFFMRILLVSSLGRFSRSVLLILFSILTDGVLVDTVVRTRSVSFLNLEDFFISTLACLSSSLSCSLVFLWISSRSSFSKKTFAS